MLIPKRRRIRISKWLIAGSCTLILITAGILLAVNGAEAPKDGQEVATNNQLTSTSQPKDISSNMLVFGNAFWGRSTNEWSMASPLKYAYPFSHLKDFHRNQYDA